MIEAILQSMSAWVSSMLNYISSVWGMRPYTHHLLMGLVDVLQQVIEFRLQDRFFSSQNFHHVLIP
jgi:hypothetical protein